MNHYRLTPGNETPAPLRTPRRRDYIVDFLVIVGLTGILALASYGMWLLTEPPVPAAVEAP